MSKKKLTIYAPDIHEGDAVGNHCIGMAQLAARLGFRIKIYAKSYSYGSKDIIIKSTDNFLNDVEDDELIFISYSIFDPFLSQVLKLPNKKICYFHDVTPPELLAEYDPITATLCEKSFSQASTLSICDFFISNSEQSAKLLNSLGIEKKIYVIPPVFKESHIFTRCVDRQNNDLTGSITLVSVGRVVPHKRIEDSISLLSKLSVNNEGKYRFKIVGSIANKNYFKFLINHAKKENVLQYISFCGMLSQVDLDRVFDGSHVLVSMSEHEGFCIPILEAMHLGIPVVLKTGTAADEFAEQVAMNIRNVDEAEKAIVSNVNVYNTGEKSLELTTQANLILERASDSHWAQLFNDI